MNRQFQELNFNVDIIEESYHVTESSRYGNEKWPVTICSRQLLTQESSRYGKEEKWPVTICSETDF